MIHVVRAAWPLFLGMAFLMLGNGLQGTLLGVRADIEGFATAVTGAVMSSFYAGVLAGAILAPRLIGQVGHVRVFAAFAAVASAAVLLHAVLLDPLLWAAMRLVSGFSFAALFIVAESWLNSETRNDARGRVLATYMVVSAGGMAFGQTLLRFADPGEFVLFTVVSVLVSIAVVPMLLSTGPTPRLARVVALDPRALWRSSPLGVVGVATSGVVAGAVLGMGAVFARQVGLSTSDVATFMFAVLLVAMLGQFPLGFLADRLDRRLVIIVAAAVAGALGIGAGFAGGVLGVVLVALAGAVGFPLYAVSVAHTNDHLDLDAMVAAAGGLTMLNGLGAAVGPFAVGVVMTAVGPAGFAWFIGAALGGLAVFGCYRTFRRAAVPLEAQGPTVVVPSVAPVATALAQEAAIEQMEADAAQVTETSTVAGPSVDVAGETLNR
jgi:MFS family permease